MPTAFKKLLHGRYSLNAPDESVAYEIVVANSVVNTLRRLLIVSGADLGDALLMLFDPKSRRCEAWIDGAELGETIAQGSADAVIASLRRRGEVPDEKTLTGEQ